MTQTVTFEGTTHEFPDDFSPADIQKALNLAHPQDAQPQAAPQGNGLSGLWNRIVSDRAMPPAIRAAGAIAGQLMPSSNMAENLPRFDATMRAAANAATFRQADKLAALGDTGVSGGSYDENLAKEQQLSQSAKQSYPGPSAIGTGAGLAINPVWKVTGPLAGRLLPMGTPGFVGSLKNIANLGLQGGIAGATDEALNRDAQKQRQAAALGAGGVAAAGMVSPPEGGGLPEFAGDVGKAFLKSGATSMVVPAAMEGGGAALHLVLSPILRKLAPDEEALTTIYKTMEEENLTPDMLAAKLEKRGPNAVLANTSPGMSKLAEDTVQFPGAPRTQAQRYYQQMRGSQFATAGGPVGRVEQAISDNLASGSARQTAQELLAQRSSEGEQAFSDLFAEPSVPSGKTWDVLSRNPAVQGAMRRGISTATNFANANGQELPASAFFVDGKPTAQAWHLAKSELDGTAYSIASGRPVNIPEGESANVEGIKTLADSIRHGLKTDVPGYADVVDKWAGKTQALDALQLGAKAARGDARVTAAVLNDMSDSEKEFFRIGLADQAQFLASKTPNGGDVVKSVFGNQNAARNLALAFENRADFNNFRKTLMQEKSITEGFRSQLGGSPTASRELGAQEMMKGMGEATLEGAKEGGAEGAIIQGVKAAGKGALTFLTQPEAYRTALAKNLYSPQANQLAETLQRLRDLENSRRMFASPGMGYLPGSLALATQKPFYFGSQ